MSAPGHLFPLRWESTGDQWWYASPIDWAAANGHYDVVRELLHLDPNLLIKLTSLRRIRRLETVWEEEEEWRTSTPICRAHIAKNLLTESENKSRSGGINKSLIEAGYGGWLLYTAAAAGDTGFVSELLERDPFLVFGEGEYGVTDLLYAAARSKNSEVFRLLLNMSLKLKLNRKGGGGGGGKQKLREEEVVDGMNGCSSSSRSFRWEMMNRAAHAAARGGNMEMMREIIAMECKDVLAFRDAQGSTLLHSASSRGQLQVVMDLISSYESSINIVSSRDNDGNRALDVAAYRGHLPVVQALLLLLLPTGTGTGTGTGTSSSSSQLLQVSEYQNNYGDTFLHMAVAGFTTPGFRRMDHQMNLMKHLLTTNYLGNLLDALINVRNNEGRTALHCAVALNIPCEVVHLLMSVPYINLNIRDHNGKTPFDLHHQRSSSSSSSNSEILIKRLISSNNSQLDHQFTRRALASHIRSQSFLLSQHHHQTHYVDVDGAGNSSRILFMMRSPGASFRITDADILFYADHDNNDDASKGTSSGTGEQQLIISNSCASESIINHPKSSSVNNAAMRLKILLRWTKTKNKNKNKNDKESSRPCSPDLSSYCDGSSSATATVSDNEESSKMGLEMKYSPTPLRQRFGKK